MNTKFPITESADLLKVLHALVLNQQALADAIGLTLPADIVMPLQEKEATTSSEKNVLPDNLSSRLHNPEAFENAFAKGYLKWSDGKLQWTLPSKTLLAYFLGRLFCGDKPRYVRSRQKYIWIPGKSIYPEAELTALFGYSVRTCRANRYNLSLPTNSQLIDNLFVK